MADNQSNQSNQGGFPQKQTTGQDTHSTTGDGHPPRPGEQGGAQQGGGTQGGNKGQSQTGGTGGYGGTGGGAK